MIDYINNKALPMIFWQRETSGNWKSYTLPVYVTKDISTLTGLREVVINFYDDPTEIGYYPRQNDIMVPAVDMNVFTGWGLSWTTPYFLDDFLENTGLGNGVLFLDSIEDNNFKFVPIVMLDEDVLFQKGNYKTEYVASHCIRNIWDRLTLGHPYLKSFSGGYLPVRYDTKNYIYYDKPETVNMKSIFESMIGGVNGDFDITMVTLRDNTEKPVTVNVINRSGFSSFSLPVTTEKIVGYSKRTRNRTEGTNLVYGYNQDTGAFYKYAWLDQSGKVTIGTTYPKTTTPRLGYCELQNEPTDGELYTRATSMLKGSLYYDYEELDFKIDMDSRYEIGTRNNPSLPSGNSNRLSTVYLNTIVQMIGITSDIVYLEVREIDLLGGYIIVGKNDDITLGD